MCFYFQVSCFRGLRTVDARPDGECEEEKASEVQERKGGKRGCPF